MQKNNKDKKKRGTDKKGFEERVWKRKSETPTSESAGNMALPESGVSEAKQTQTNTNKQKQNQKTKSVG